MTRTRLPFSEAGWWWLPDSPDARLPGRLEVDDAGAAALTLTIEASTIPFTAGAFDIPVIHGQTPAGVDLSPLKCLELGSHGGLTGLREVRVRPHTVIRGAFLDAPDEACFRSLHVRYRNLKAFLVRTGARISHGRRKIANVDVSYRRPAAVRTVISPDHTLTLHYEVSISASPKGKEVVSIGEEAVASFESRTPRSLSEFLNLAWRLQVFLSLATQRLCQPRSVTAEVQTDSPRLVLMRGRSRAIEAVHPASLGTISEIVDTRNNLTHYDTGGSTQRVRGERLYYLAEVGRFVLEVCFLNYAGLPLAQIATLYSRHPRYARQLEHFARL